MPMPLARVSAVLPPALRGWLGTVAALAASVVVVLGCRYAGVGEPGRVDTRVQAAVDGVGSPWRYLALTADALGEPARGTLAGALIEHFIST
ncbi:hypothetical protein [Kitasatospora sp. NPDC047058]|uniref:hypothetical protein n=1 Tax=Kitasatospora sp. NPDC047058 TaxID=3155620 RepID=UPI0033EDCFC2